MALYRFIPALATLLVLSCGTVPSGEPGRSLLRSYTNPVGGDSLLMGDPFVLKHDARYYLFGTTDPAVGFRCYTSSNLVDWQEAGFAYRAGNRAWATAPFWVPEVAYYDGRFYMTYSGGDRTSSRLLTARPSATAPKVPTGTCTLRGSIRATPS